MELPGHVVVGVDEAGVGCVMGDLCAAAVVLCGDCIPAGLTDSKVLSEKRRKAYAETVRNEHFYGIGVVTSAEINEVGLGESRRIVFHRALDDLIERNKLVPTKIIVDGTLFEPYRSIPHVCVPKADSLFPCVSAASVVAKTHRDTRLAVWCSENPKIAERYGLIKNKGYITREHKNALRKYGFTEYHRRYCINL